ncbi:MAG: acyl-CoA reductase [Polyangiaceae bacterium]
MSEDAANRIARVQRLIEAATVLADPEASLGQRAREVLPAETGLSPENVALCLSEVLETHASESELATLLDAATPCRKAHVLLAANVFTAPLRAIALALAQAPAVEVRPSRRQPTFTELLLQASPGTFRIVSELSPAPDEHVWAYGRDENLSTVHDELPAGVVFHAHGTGFGAAVVSQALGPDLSATARAIARDVTPFDQRGCLSPRIVLARGDDGFARELAEALARALAAQAHDVPLGSLSSDEAAEIARYRDTLLYAGLVYPAGKGLVGLDLHSNVLLAPIGRNLHIARVDDPLPPLRELAPHLTSVSAPAALHAALRDAVPHARLSELGEQQRPPLDGPVDLRESAAGELL